MENVTIQDIINAANARLLCGDPLTPVKHLCTDSKQMSPGDLFVPVIGARVDAHRFIKNALEQSGTSTLTSEDDHADSVHPYIRVNDTIAAMQQIAAWYRSTMSLPMVGITGSVGKTTTREMIAHVLKGSNQVFETIGNQNSQIGVPLSLSHLSASDDIGVMEMGMSEPGQIKILGSMIRPDCAVITNIGVSHIEQMKTQDAICLEKMDIQEFLPKNGLILLNGDDPMIRKHINAITHRYAFYGFQEDCSYRAVNPKEKNDGVSFVFCYEDIQEEIFVGVPGRHNISNALAAIAIGLHYHVPMEVIKKQLSTFSGQRQNILNIGGYTVIDDAYNASPDSMIAALRLLDSFHCNGRKIAVLSDMLELGPRSNEYHQQVGTFLAGTSITDLLVTGDFSKEYISSASQKNPDITCQWFSSNHQLTDWLKNHLKEGDTILIKASNGMKLYEIAEQLSNAFQ